MKRGEKTSYLCFSIFLFSIISFYLLEEENNYAMSAVALLVANYSFVLAPVLGVILCDEVKAAMVDFIINSYYQQKYLSPTGFIFW
jgi:hypothetical protein